MFLPVSLAGLAGEANSYTECSNMEEYGYREIVSLWASGTNVAEIHLWGIKVLWWGRIGFATLFMSVAVMAITFIGTSKIRKFRGDVKNHSKMVAELAVGALLSFLTLFSKDPSSEYDPWLEHPVGQTIAGFGCLISTVIFLVLWIRNGFWDAVVTGIFLAIFTTIFLPLLCTFWGLILAAFLISIVVAILTPLIWVLSKESIVPWIRTFAMLLTFSGLHFLILAH